MTGAEDLERRDPKPIFVEPATDSDYFGCESILRSLPEWFGIEAAIDDYVAAIKTMQTLIVRESDKPVGFLALTNHNSSTSEIDVMAVRRPFQRTGIGSALVDAAVQSAHSTGHKPLEVKTLGPSDPNENYAATRRFYESMGFLSLGELHDLWPGNPCLIMVKVVDEHQPRQKGNTALLRIENHPILGDPPAAEIVEISFDGNSIEARAGEPVAATLLAAGIRSFRTMAITCAPRGIFTGVGRSIEELGSINGEANLPLMSVPVEAGMAVETQLGLGTQGDNS